MASLSSEQVSQYWKRGYINRVPVLTQDEVAQFRTEFDRVESEWDASHGGLWVDRAFQPWSRSPHPLEDWFIELAVHPRILDAVESIIGPDILVRNADIFTKNVGSEEEVDWHVDSAMDDPTVDGLVTAWIGLSESIEKNGAMRFAIGTHRDGVDRGKSDSLVLEEAAIEEIEKGDLVYNEMPAGHLSMHHFRLVHGSSFNVTAQRRVGYVIRYMAPHVTQEAAEAGAGMLARGRDTANHFALKPNFPVSWDVDHELLQAAGLQ